MRGHDAECFRNLSYVCFFSVAKWEKGRENQNTHEKEPPIIFNMKLLQDSLNKGKIPPSGSQQNGEDFADF